VNFGYFATAKSFLSLYIESKSLSQHVADFACKYLEAVINSLLELDEKQLAKQSVLAATVVLTFYSLLQIVPATQ